VPVDFLSLANQVQQTDCFRNVPIGGTAHQAGTLRFGTDPEQSVLDLNCKAHGNDNLYLTDASFFPSIGAVHPTLTIIANALRGRRPYRRKNFRLSKSMSLRAQGFTGIVFHGATHHSSVWYPDKFFRETPRGQEPTHLLSPSSANVAVFSDLTGRALVGKTRPSINQQVQRRINFCQ
jgi:hypothetical protein